MANNKIKTITKKNDFIELDFVARIKDGNVFDTTIESEAQKAGILKENEKDKRKFEPVKLCIGQDMILHGLDIELSSKEVGKECEIELKPENAFGKRNPKLIKIFSLGSFLKKGVEPVPGVFVNINDMIAKIVGVSGGRVIADFNNPLADKTVIYKINIKRIITDEKEKIDSLAKFYLRDYEIKEKVGEGKDKDNKKKKYELVVKGKKIEALDKKLKDAISSLDISYES